MIPTQAQTGKWGSTKAETYSDSYAKGEDAKGTATGSSSAHAKTKKSESDATTTTMAWVDMNCLYLDCITLQA